MEEVVSAVTEKDAQASRYLSKQLDKHVYNEEERQVDSVTDKSAQRNHTCSLEDNEEPGFTTQLLKHLSVEA